MVTQNDTTEQNERNLEAQEFLTIPPFGQHKVALSSPHYHKM